MERVLAQATPTPAMARRRGSLLWITPTERRPAAPVSRHRVWVARRPKTRAIAGRAKEKAKQTAE
jgi:hypothetical protein